MNTMGLIQYLLRRRFEKKTPEKTAYTGKATAEKGYEPEKNDWAKKAGDNKNMMNEVQNLLQDTNERIDRIQNLVGQLGGVVETSQKSIEEKVHTEGVKIYRNVQAVLEDMEKKMATQEKLQREVLTLKNYLKGLMGFSVVTMVVLVVFVLYSMGVF